MTNEHNWQGRWLSRNTPWDLGDVTPALNEWLVDNDVSGWKVLVPGCGLGHDAAAWSKAGAEVTAVDLAPAALESAADLYGSNIKWRLANILSLKLPDKYDAVWEYTCFCALSPSVRSDYLYTVRSNLKAKGRYFGMVFLQVPSPGQGPPFAISPLDWKQTLEIDFELVNIEAPTSRSITVRQGAEIWFEAQLR